ESPDDVLLAATSVVGLQRKIDLFYQWCRENLMRINALKTYIAMHGPKPSRMPQFTVAQQRVSVVTQYTYLGVVFTTNTQNMFKEHFSTKAAVARRAAHGVLHIESMIGLLPPKEGKILYMGRVDPHLIYACEVMPDASETLLEELYQVQKAFLRRILGVHKRSMLAPLHTETGVVPLRYRRLELALRYLEYLGQRPTSTYACAAFIESRRLMQLGARSWLADLGTVLRSIGATEALEKISEERPPIDLIQKHVARRLHASLREAIHPHSKAYLLSGRKEPQVDGPPREIQLCLRHYLEVPKAEHRRALTRVLMGCHLLALEKLAWKERYRQVVPHSDRLCRFCRAQVETAEHALLHCSASDDLLETRR
ncbi:hypothetical protein AURDEDRAFT_25589, partial [Auricularia subglabra TFB-10046 SS5]